jgi:aspartate racemase
MKDILSDKKTIGILGGMGSVASVNLYDQIIKKAQQEYGAKEDHEFPPIILYNLPLVGLGASGISESNTDIVKSQLIDGVGKLEKWGSDFIVIACNTVHKFHKEMQESINIPVVNILDETADEVWHAGYRNVGVVSSNSSNRWGLYKEVLERKGINAISMSEEQGQKVEQVIADVMTGLHLGKDRDVLKSVVVDLEKRGAEGVILGCTELPLVLNQEDVETKIFDSTNILAKAAMRTSVEGKKLTKEYA